MRPRLIISLLKLKLFSQGNIKNFNFILNIGIFLGIFAVTSTLISIFQENKITNLERKISKTNLIIETINTNMSIIPKKIIVLENIKNDYLKQNDFLYTIYFSNLNKLNPNLVSSYEVYYKPTINFVNFVNNSFITLEQFNNINTFLKILDKNPYAQTIYIDEKKKEEYEKIVNINKQNKIEFNDYKNSLLNVYQSKKNFNQSLTSNYKKYRNDLSKYTDDQIQQYSQLLQILNSTINSESNKVEGLRNDIKTISNKSSKYILFAFFLQLIIFIIIQSMEIITTRREINEK